MADPSRDSAVADAPAAHRRVPARLLEPGGRFPNFVLPYARPGAAVSSFSYYRDVLAGPSIILLGRAPPSAWRGANSCFSRHGANLISISADPNPANGLPNSVTLLLDRDDKLLRHLRDGDLAPIAPTIIVIDANQRIVAYKHDPDAAALIAWAQAELDAMPMPTPAILSAGAPVLLVERVLTPAFCRHLIDVWAADHHEGRVSATVDGKPAALLHDAMKRRLDHKVPQESPLYGAITDEIARKVATEVKKAFQYRRFRAGEYFITCYDAARGDFFRAHRDDTTPQAAKRRFALTINLNADYDGGELIFPEFGPIGYRTGAGGGIVFSCSLMHEARPVRRGRRFALLAFLIDPEQ